MKTRLIAMQLATLIVSVQAGAVLGAGTADTGPGCGLGKLLWSSSKHPKNIAPQVMMWFTNGTGLASFAISTGTSGCTNDGVIMAEHQVNVFATINFENLSQEMAQGRGEHLASLATLMGVPVEHQIEFFALTQAQYESLIQSGETTPIAMLNTLHEAMAGHPVLAKLSAAR